MLSNYQILLTDTLNDPEKEAITKNIQRALKSESQTLLHGSEFTGRPVTGIYASCDHVVKIKGEYSFNQSDALRWIQQRQEKEALLNVYHPQKHWYLLINQDEVFIANITPRLQPLHQLLKMESFPDKTSLLNTMLSIYFKVSEKQLDLLDGGLSNFAIDKNNQMYYLDDDIYRWDNFHALGQTFAVWFRSLWLTNDMAKQIGHDTYHLTLKYFNQHSLSVITKHVTDARLFSLEQIARKDAFVQSFLRARKQTSQSFPHPLETTPLALLGDIHANHPALQQVLRQLDQDIGTYNLLILGDIVGYGPHPKEVIQTLRKHNPMVIKGNHDLAVSEKDFGKGFSRYGREVATWTSELLNDAELDWLKKLPEFIQQKNWLAVHGSPIDPQFLFGYVYTMTYEANLDNMRERKLSCCFHGHSHIQGLYYRSNHYQTGFSDASSQDLNNYKQALICPGSVGQPREGKGNHARYAIYYPQQRSIEFHQVAYDVEATITDMQTHDFPEVLMQRLRDGI